MYSAKSRMHSATDLLSVTVGKRDSVYTLQAKWTLPKKIKLLSTWNPFAECQNPVPGEKSSQTKHSGRHRCHMAGDLPSASIGKREGFVSCKHSLNRMNMWENQARLVLLALVICWVVAPPWSSQTLQPPQGDAVAMDLTGQGHHLLHYPPPTHIMSPLRSVDNPTLSTTNTASKARLCSTSIKTQTRYFLCFLPDGQNSTS